MPPLELDTRQRAMLAEMGVRVWQPQSPDSLQSIATADADLAQATPPVAVIPSAAMAVAAPVSDASRSTLVHGEPVSRPAVRALQPGVASPVPGTPASVQVTSQPLHLQALDASALVQAAAQCQACTLCAGRKNTTLSLPDMAVQMDWMVVGEAPDEDEDRLGQPFAEQSGQLLDNMLRAVSASRGGAARQGAYVSNVVKCRPPQGRVPQAGELAQCAQYLQREIALVQPKVIVAMGRFAAQLLLSEHPEQAAQPLGKQRGTVYRYQGIPVVVTYHPKVLLRASTDKGKAWADLCLAMDVLDACLQ